MGTWRWRSIGGRDSWFEERDDHLGREQICPVRGTEWKSDKIKHHRGKMKKMEIGRRLKKTGSPGIEIWSELGQGKFNLWIPKVSRKHEEPGKMTRGKG